MTNRALAYTLALAIFAVDQLTKWIVTAPLRLQEVGQIELLPIFNLTWVENYGISLGLLNAETETGRWLLVALTAGIAIGVAWWIGREEKRGDQLALALVLGGALGNIVDRVRHGYVVDFADLHFGAFRPFLVFNVADAAISIGVVILLLRAFLLRDVKKTEDGAPEGTNEHA
ncbi:MAG TPA: signal peptidase II [Sphingomicrobium sp.]|nr:signal peptidase II [Sphingomicrobium sp.]